MQGNNGTWVLHGERFCPAGRVLSQQYLAEGTAARVWGTCRRPSHIIGLVASSKYRSLREPPPPTFYVQPLWISPSAGMLNLYVRTYGDPELVIPEVRQRIRATDPHMLRERRSQPPTIV